MSNLSKCKCEIGPIVRFINFQVMDGINTVFLDQYVEKLSCTGVMDKLNNCLKKHGFKGKVSFVEGFAIYGDVS